MVDVTRAYAVGLDVRRRLLWQGLPVQCYALDAMGGLVWLASFVRGVGVLRQDGGYVVTIADIEPQRVDVVNRVQRIQIGSLLLQVEGREDPPNDARRLWRLRCSPVAR